MNDPARPSLLERLSALLMRAPSDRDQLVELLRSAYSRNLLDADALSIIEGALNVSEMQVRDIMIPRAQVDFIDINEPIESFIPQVMATAHSRFPVIDQNRDDVIGILLAKDLLRHYAGEEEFNVREMLRPAVFVPEAKRLNVLLREFRASRNHMAIVVDEYGGVSGLVTIEDVLEQIVGEIEDEYDFDEASDNIIPEPGGRFRVKALTQIAKPADRLCDRLEVAAFDQPAVQPIVDVLDQPGIVGADQRLAHRHQLARGKRDRLDRLAQEESDIDHRQVAARIGRVADVHHVLQAELARELLALCDFLLVTPQQDPERPRPAPQREPRGAQGKIGA